MVNQMIRFKVTVNELECNFYFDSAASTAIAKEAVFECLKWLGNIEEAAKKDAMASAAQAESSQEEKPNEVSDV